MSSKVTAALQNLNKATGDRQYDIKQSGDRYVLQMPGGGEYPSSDENKTVERLITLRNCAVGYS